jgi:hypothetical protein
MKNTGKTRLQTQAISALLTKPTIEAAAKSCGITGRTLLTWLQQPKFQEQYAQAKHDLLEGAVNRLRTAGFDAGMRLHKIVNDPDAPITAVVSAAGRLLELLLKSVEIEDLSKRLDRLEASMRAEQ